jgi:Zn-dependent protease with chaperone function
MLTGELAILFNLINIAALGIAIALTLLLCLAPLIKRFVNTSSPVTLSKGLWVLVTLPWCVGLLCFVLFAPTVLLQNQYIWLTELVHWHHPKVFYFNSWHSWTLLVPMLFILFKMGKLFRHAYVNKRQIEALTQLSDAKRTLINSREIWLLNSGIPTAFTAGLFSPKCYLTKGLVEQVSAQELDIIIRHEMAHIAHKDSVFKMLFSLCAALYPNVIAKQLKKLFSLSKEQIADASVSQIHDKLDIATTLIKVARIQLSTPNHFTNKDVLFFGADDVSLRVKQLISADTKHTTPLLPSLVCIGLLLLVSIASVDSLHHLIDAIFTH